MQACLRSYDILGRMGGDEFTALLELEFPEQAAKIAEKLIDTVISQWALNCQKLAVVC